MLSHRAHAGRFGDLDLSCVVRVCEAIGQALRGKSGRHIIVVRSTMLPGSIQNTVIPALERASGKKADADFGVVFNPEFLRESTAVHDFYHPPKTVIGARLKRSGMFWTVRGANAILALRCCNLNGRFEDYWEARRAA